jgi:DNA invertase Pin-like site-specific DNA recombinase
MGRMVFTMVAAVAELERELIRERVIAGVRRAQAQGTETKRQRICRIVGGCDGKVRFFALYNGKAERIDRREVEWALHQRFKPTISTARRPRRPKG